MIITLLYLKIIIFNKSYAFLEINYFTNVFFKFVILPKFFNYYEFFFFKKNHLQAIHWDGYLADGTHN